MIHIGFTGTRKGLTVAQEDTLIEWLSKVVEVGFDIFAHHGDCVGADKQFHSMIRQLGGRVCLHPPDKDRYRAYCKHYEIINEPKPYLDRNKDIVRDSELMLATPGEATMQLRSGTWSTVRFAIGLGKTTNVILPDGQMVYDWKDA